MNRFDYVSLLDRIEEHGADSRLHWAGGPQAGTFEPWDGSALPWTPARGLGEACFDTADGCFFVEALVGDPRMVIVGAGHVGVAFARVAATLGFRITVIDPRESFLDPARFPEGVTLLCGPFEQTLASLPEYANTYYVLVTPGHASDRECAGITLRRPSAYVGMIGSRGKVATVVAALRADGLSEERIAFLHAPIGLSIGGREPAEIAISIAAEIIGVRAALGSVAFDPEIARELRALAAEPERRVVLATIIGHGGSAPRGTGSRMLVGPDGRTAGSTGGGSVEAASIEQAMAMLADGRTIDLADYDLSNTEGARLGMICGGRVRVLFERL